MGCLDGKVVVVVTGAGRGVGRAIALAAAEAGAAVVVNDLGAATDGSGGDPGPAQAVCGEIAARGGRAAASLRSVADPDTGAAIVTTALEAFGRIDAVVNNAGVVRGAIFHKLGPDDFEAVLRVNLFGAFHVARAAAPHFRSQGSGAYLHLTSTTGLVGGLAQASYVTSKLALVGLSRAIALDMAAFGVRSNCIAPFAWSRMAAKLTAGDERKRLRLERLRAMTPDMVAPLAVYLLSDLSAGVTGQIFVSRGHEVSLMSQPRPLASLAAADGWTPERLAEQLPQAFGGLLTPLEQSSDVFEL